MLVFAANIQGFVSVQDFQLIERQSNPILRFGRQLGRDEAYAAVLGAVATGAAWWLVGVLWDGDPPPWLLATVLTLVAPVLEKPGLIAHYVGEGVAAWRRVGGPISGHLRRSLCDGRAWRTVRADLLFHDPAYGGLMLLGALALAPTSAAGAALLSALAFGGAVCLAATAEVALVELSHLRLTRALRHAGFEADAYYETRYLLVHDEDRHAPRAVLGTLADHLSLPDRRTLHVEDSYLPRHGLREANGRTPAVRLRTTRDAQGEVIGRSLQVTFTRPGEVGREDPSLFRCFAVRKETFTLTLPRHGEPSASEGFRRASRRLGIGEQSRRVTFAREVARDRGGLHLSADVPGSGAAYWVEAKVRRDLSLLKEANALVATRYPVRGTTQGKFHVVERMAEFGGTA